MGNLNPNQNQQTSKGSAKKGALREKFCIKNDEPRDLFKIVFFLNLK